MVTDRQGALRRLNGLSIRVEQHLEKIAKNPVSDEVPHWKSEIRQWIIQMEHVLPRRQENCRRLENPDCGLEGAARRLRPC